MDIRDLEGYQFLKVATACFCEEGIRPIFDGNDIHWRVALDIIFPETLSAEQSVYLVFVGEDSDPVYVGQYSETFEKRWLKAKKYVWHSENVDMKIKGALEAGKEVTVWLSLNPYVKTTDGRVLNVNKAIEQLLIDKLKPQWNTVGKGGSTGKGVSVGGIFKKYAQPHDKERFLAAEYGAFGLNDYRERLVEPRGPSGESDGYDISWGDLQNMKSRNFNRLSRFVELVKAGKEEEPALAQAWDEIPGRQL